VIGIFVFTLGVLVASIIHRDLFSFSGLAAWLWFGGFSLATLFLGVMIARNVLAGGSK
jgi:hypothetical protein